jgi:orotate phosphoribosyltransferase
MVRTQEEWISEYQQKGALWIHDGNKLRPHALLTSGKHSNGFFNSRLVIPDEVLLRDAAIDLVELFVQHDGDTSKVQSVVGPQTGATKLSELIRDQFGLLDTNKCSWASPAKNEVEGVKSMVFSDEDRSALLRQTVLLCEDVLTTGGSIDLTASAILNAGGIILPFLLVLVNRSGLTEVCGMKIVALIDRPMPMWTPSECPLCEEGSQAIRPKENWSALNAAY